MRSRFLKKNYVRPAIFPAGNWPEVGVIGVKMGNMAKNGLEMGLKRVEMGNINSKLIGTLKGHVFH